MYLYRYKKGVNTFTGFVQKGDNIIWVGKDEKSIHPIQTETDRLFFLNEMKQYDK
jgi:hypothetical protein